MLFLWFSIIFLFFYFLIITITFIFNYPFPPPPCPCFFVGLHWFYTFKIISLLFNLIHAFSLIFICFLIFCKFLLEQFKFLWFSCSFLLTNAFFGFIVARGFYFFSWKFLAAVMLCDCYFLPQCNLILNCFWIISLVGCSNHTFRRLMPHVTHNQVGQAQLAKMHLLTKSSISHCSFQISSHLLVKRI